MFSDLDDERDERLETEEEKSDPLLIILKILSTIHYLWNLILFLGLICGDIVAATFAIISTWLVIKWTKIFSFDNNETKSPDSH